MKQLIYLLACCLAATARAEVVVTDDTGRVIHTSPSQAAMAPPATPCAPRAASFVNLSMP